MIAALRLFVVLNLLICVVVFLLLPINEQRALLILLGHLSLSALLIAPALLCRDIKIVDPLILFAIYVVIGGLLPVYLITDDSSPRILYLMNGLSEEDILWVGLWYCLSLFLVGFGYAVVRRRLAVERYLPRDSSLSSSGVRVAIVVALIAATLASVTFVARTGDWGTTIETLSKKRAIEVSTGEEVVFAAGGYLRMGGEFAAVMAMIAMAYFLHLRGRVGALSQLMLAGLIAVSCVIPFVSSSRSSVIFVVLGLGLVLYAYGRLTKTWAVSVITALMVVFGLMSALRSLAQSDGEVVFENPFGALAESGNGYSLFGTAHVLLGVPEKMDYKFGATYLTWIVAPVPRALWPDKPDVSLGKEIKEVILEQEVIRSGRPPSFISEGWINFGAIGLLINSILMGVAMRFIALSFIPIMNRSVLSPALYYSVALNSAALANSSISQAITRIGADVAMVVAIYLLVRLGASFQARRNTGAAARFINSQ